MRAYRLLVLLNVTLGVAAICLGIFFFRIDPLTSPTVYDAPSASRLSTFIQQSPDLDKVRLIGVACTTEMEELTAASRLIARDYSWGVGTLVAILLAVTLVNAFALMRLSGVLGRRQAPATS